MKWPRRTIGSFIDSGAADVQTGPFGTQLKASDYVEVGAPVINVRNIGYSDLRAEKLEFITEQTASRLSVHALEKNDIVFGRKGAVDRHLFVQDEHVSWVQGSDCIRLRFKSEELMPRFVSYALLREEHKKWILAQSGNKATMASLNQDVIRRIELYVPPTPIQARIVEALQAFDDLIENNRRRIKLLEDSARLLYREWFVHLRFPGHEHVKMMDGVPEGWEVRRLDEISNDVRTAVKPGNISLGTPYIGLEHMPRRSITLSDWGQSDEVMSQKFAYQTGDILFGKIRPYFHKVGFALTDGITSSDAIVIRSTDPRLYHFLLLLVSSDQFVALASKTVKEGSKMPRADWKFMQRQTFAVPPDELLGELNEICEPIIGQLKSLAGSNVKLREARDLLLPRLMNGAITV